MWWFGNVLSEEDMITTGGVLFIYLVFNRLFLITSFQPFVKISSEKIQWHEVVLNTGGQ